MKILPVKTLALALLSVDSAKNPVHPFICACIPLPCSLPLNEETFISSVLYVQEFGITDLNADPALKESHGDVQSSYQEGGWSMVNTHWGAPGRLPGEDSA